MGNEIPRGSYKPIGNPVFANGITTVVYEVTEPLFISPLSTGDYNSMGFSQVSTMDVDISWDTGKITRLFSIDEAGVTTNAAGNYQGVNVANLAQNTGRLDLQGSTVSFEPADSSITFIYLTPQINRLKPESLIYPYHDLYVYHKNLGIINAGAERENQVSDNMSLSSIPNRVYIYAKIKENDQSAFTFDAFCRIKRIDVNFNGVSGILSSSREHELYRLSEKNGLKIAC